MTHSLPADSQFNIASLVNYQLSKILLGTTGQSLRLEFTSETGGGSIALELFNLVQLVFSRVIDDEGSFFVGEISLIPIMDGGEQMLSLLNYSFLNKDGRILSYPSKTLLHFRMEGGVCLEAVCHAYTLLQPWQSESVEWQQ